MKKNTLLLLLICCLTIALPDADAQCTSYFQSQYNAVTDEMDFTPLCTYDTAITPIIYQWDFGDGTTAFGENPSHHYATGNNYLVCLVLYVGNGAGCCQDTFCELIDFVPSAIEKSPDWISDLAVHSSDNNVKLFLTMTRDTDVQMNLITTNGMLIPVSIASTLFLGRNEIDLDMPGYPPGVYMLIIGDPKGNRISKRFVIN